MRIECRLFTTGGSFELGDISVETFMVPHDAQDPVGFLIRTIAGNIGFLTDLGHTNKMVIERIRPANVLVLEANHDVKMLQDSPHRPWSLKQRILGRHGHLSNEAAADAAEQAMSAQLRHLYLGHLSRECNKPEIAKTVMQKRTAENWGHACAVGNDDAEPSKSYTSIGGKSRTAFADPAGCSERISNSDVRHLVVEQGEFREML